MSKYRIINNNWNKHASVLLFLLLNSFAQPSHGQIQQTERYEIVQKNSDEYFTVVSLEEEGLALIREKDKYEGNKQLWEIITLDTNISETNKFDVEINQRHKL